MWFPIARADGMLEGAGHIEPADITIPSARPLILGGILAATRVASSSSMALMGEFRRKALTRAVCTLSIRKMKMFFMIINRNIDC